MLRGALLSIALTLMACHGQDANEGSDEAITLPSTRVERLSYDGAGVQVKLYIALPKSYETDKTKRYPVVYALDADYSFAIARNIVEHLSDRGGLPELIVVGIAYEYPTDSDPTTAYRINRTRDYTPTYSAEGYAAEIQRYSGGASRFLRFLEERAIRRIEARYRTTDRDRTIVGHSYGALFATYALLMRPTLFRRAILVSPSYWYDDHVIERLAQGATESLSHLAAKLYLGIGQREVRAGRDMVADMQRMARVLGTGSGIDLYVDVRADEDHDSVFPGALSTGLRFAFGRLKDADSSPSGKPSP